MAHIRSRKHVTPSHILALMAVALPVTVNAQESEKSLPAMTVKAGAEVPFKADVSANSKFTQPLLDTPQTVQVIKKEILQEQGAASLMEALRNTPGITMQLGENGNSAAGDSFMMRGFSTEASTFVDGIRDLGAVTRDVFNVEQVEVAKGPAGADIGRGSQSGYINLISKLPQASDINNANVALGSDDYKRLSADLNKQIGEGVAMRLNVMGQDSDVAGRDRVKKESYGVAPSIAFGLNSPTRLYLYSQHIRQDNVPDGGISTIGMKGFYNADAAIRAGAKVDPNNYYGSKDDYEKIDADMVTAKVEHDLGGGSTLRNITRWGRNKMDRVLTGVNTITAVTANDPSTWTLSRSRQGVNQIDEIVANQTSLNTEFNTGGIKHSLSAGLELTQEKRRNNTIAFRGVTPAANLYHPDAGDAMGEAYKSGAYTSGETKTASLYAFDTLELHERFLLNAGLRFDRYKLETDNLAINATTGAKTLTKLDASDSLFSWKLGAVFKPAANGSIYAAYATSLTPPGGNNFQLSATATNQANAGMDPQETVNIELGTKWELLDKRLNLATAVFRTENDKQTSTDPVTNVVSQFGKTRVDGIEVSAVGQLTNFWQVSAGVAKMKTKQIDQVSVNATTGVVTENVGVRWSPDLTATLWTSYTLGDFTLGGGARYVSEQKRTISAGTKLSTQNMPKIPSYWVADLMAAYKLSKNVNLRLNVYNLFDKEYIATLNNSGARMTLGTPRSAVLSANLQF
jgi:catecholate siderophore receptor